MPQLIIGETAAGRKKIVRVNDAGEILTSSGGASGLPTATSSTIVTLTTSGTAGTYVAFGSQAATHVDIVNNTGVKLRIRKVGTTAYQDLADGQGYMVFPVTNANEVEASLDVTGGAVVVRATAYAG